MRCTRRAGLLAVLAALSSGCFGPTTARPVQLFVLAPTVPAGAPQPGGAALRLAIGRISLPEILNRPQIVTRTGANEVRVADFAQWAEPLEQSVPRVIAENLARLLGTERVVVYPWPTQLAVDYRVEVAVIELEGSDDGEARLAARWRLLREDGSEATPLRLSAHAERAADASIGAMAAALSRTLEALSRDIADAIASSAA
ncbi:MAG TPA: PqiC family protein [Myxococcota bacterium]|nr:PqiC family protein [Myxococcota bacterium]